MCMPLIRLRLRWDTDRRRGPPHSRATALSSDTGSASARHGSAPMLPMPHEVQIRLAIAEQLTQLASRRGDVSRAHGGSAGERHPTADKEQMEVLQSRAALFQDLGLLGIPLMDIQYALAKGISLEELLRKAQDGLVRADGTKTEQEAEAEEQKLSVEDSESSNADNGKCSHEKVYEVAKEDDTCIESASAAKEDEVETKMARERLTAREEPNDSIFPRRMVESALSIIGVELTAA